MSAKTTPLEELCELVVDCPHSTPKWKSEGVIVLRNQNIRNGQLDLSSPSYTDEEGYQSRIKRAVPQAGDIVFTREAPMGEVCLIPEGLKCCLGQRQVLLRPKKEISGEYLYWALQSPFVQHQISWNEGTGTTVSNVRIPVLKSLEIPRQSEHEQSIANILGALSERIQSNRQINQTLEKIAQAIFKSWFVDFEPVKAKIAAMEAGGSEEDALLAAMQAVSGKSANELAHLQTEQAEHYANLRTTAELFPSAMQESELGEIPEGWDSSIVGKEFDVTMGQSPPGDTYNEEGNGPPFFQGRRDFGERFPCNRVHCSAPKRMANEGDTLLSVRAPVGDTNIALMDSCIGRGLAALRHRSGCLSFTYYSIIELGGVLASYDSEGTVFGSINQKNLKAIPVVSPAPEVLSAFTRTVGPIDDLIRVNSEEVTNLSSVRDALLPKLLSGELTVPEVVGEEDGFKEAANV